VLIVSLVSIQSLKRKKPPLVGVHEGGGGIDSAYQSLGPPLSANIPFCSRPFLLLARGRCQLPPAEQ